MIARAWCVAVASHSCARAYYTRLLWSLACTHVNIRAHAFLGPGLLAPAPPRSHAENADLASDFLCAEGQDATSSCVPVSEEVQGPLCGATCAGVTAYGGFNEALLDEGIPDGTEVTITFAFTTMTDEMCTAACAISEASCMENPGNPVFTCLGAIDGPSAPVPVPAPAEE